METKHPYSKSLKLNKNVIGEILEFMSREEVFKSRLLSKSFRDASQYSQIKKGYTCSQLEAYADFIIYQSPLVNYKNLRIYMFGGRENYYTFHNFMKYFDLQTKTWVEEDIGLSTRPPPRYSHTMLLHQEKLIIYNGCVNHIIGKRFNDMWYYHILEKRYEEVEQKGQKPKWSGADQMKMHSMALCQDQLFVFGGAPQVTNEFYKFCLARETWTRIYAKGSVPSPRYSMNMASINDKIYILGGKFNKTILNELYEYNLTINKFQTINLNLPSIGEGSLTTFIDTQKNEGLAYLFAKKYQNHEKDCAEFIKVYPKEMKWFKLKILKNDNPPKPCRGSAIACVKDKFYLNNGDWNEYVDPRFLCISQTDYPNE